MNDTEIVKPETMAELVAVYEQNKRDIEALKAPYEKVKNLLCGGMYRGSDIIDFKATLNSLQKTAWREIIDRSGLFSLMSIEKAEKIKKGLYYNDHETCESLGIPEFTVENIVSFIDNLRFSIPDMLDEKILEVYKILRPRNYYDLKTNAKSLFEGIGKKVILSYFFEQKWTGGIRIRFQKREEINAIQEVFRLLDGKGVAKDGEKLYYCLENSLRSDVYEDEYFKVKGFINSNAHFEFKRMDLVARIVATTKEKLFGKVA